jgi:FkbM family methyltransferase
VIGSVRARAALMDVLCRILTGEGLSREERAGALQRLRLFGFRKTAVDLLMRRVAQGARRQGGFTLLAPALEGSFTLAVSGNDLGVGWEVVRTGTYEPHLVRFYRRTLRPGMTVVDVGANVGFHALHAARLVGSSGRVVAVEPDADNVALLRLSLSLAPESLPVEIIEAALSDRDGELILSDLGNADNSGARFTHDDRARLEDHVHGPDPVFRTVPALCWDTRFPDRPVDLVKLDIEGFEPRALAGMERSLARYRPVVVSEFAPSNLKNLGGVEPLAFLAWFRDRGYVPALIDGDGEAVPRSPEQLVQEARRSHHVDLAFQAR